jgi:hypothetical protein
VSTELVPVTTWTRKVQHQALVAELKPDLETGGRFGRPLCDGQTYAEVYDQVWLDFKRMQWFGKPAGSQVITEMRSCKRCEKAARLTNPQT